MNIDQTSAKNNPPHYIDTGDSEALDNNADGMGYSALGMSISALIKT